MNKYIAYIIIGKFRYNYKYTSPFGEEWIVYRLLFGFIHITHKSFIYKGIEKQHNVSRYVNFLNYKINNINRIKIDSDLLGALICIILFAILHVWVMNH